MLKDAFGAQHGAVAHGEDWLTPELIPVKPIYTKDDLQGMEHLNFMSGIPRSFVARTAPCILFVLGQSVSMQVSTAAESNAFYRRNLASGQKGLSVAFDLATHRGYDADHELLLRT